MGVLLADDSEVIRKAVTRLLEMEPAIKVLGVAASFAEVIEMATKLKPDVVLLDLHMPDDHAFDSAFVKSQLSGARVLGMSFSGGEDDETRALGERFGAVTVLDKAQLSTELIPAILTA